MQPVLSQVTLPARGKTGPWKDPPRHGLICRRPMGPPRQRAWRSAADAVSVWHDLSWPSHCCRLSRPPGVTPASRLCAQLCPVQPSRLAGFLQFRLAGRAPAAPSPWLGTPALPQRRFRRTPGPAAKERGCWLGWDPVRPPGRGDGVTELLGKRPRRSRWGSRPACWQRRWAPVVL